MNRNERGTSAVEYALLLSGIAAILALAIFAIGPVVNDMYTDTCEGVAAEDASTVAC